ncbi:hypothetical protein D918_07366 [Trichuris suis]|nr:hypothetical protein D918_07366 [Trichuris suis]
MMPVEKSDYPTNVESGNSGSAESDEDDNTLMVDFVGQCPSEEDKDGISKFLVELFPGNKVDLDQLAAEIGKNSYIGSVFKMHSNAEEDQEMEDGLEALSDDFLFGVVSAFELTPEGEETKPSVSQVIDFLIAKCNSSKASNSTKKSCIELLKSCDRLFFLVNERIETMPPKIAALALKALLKDLANFEFNNIVMVAKLVQTEVKGRSKSSAKASAASSDEESYLFAEERQFDLHSQLRFDYEHDGGSEGEKAIEMEGGGKAFNRVVFMEKDEFIAAVNEIIQLYNPE